MTQIRWRHFSAIPSRKRSQQFHTSIFREPTHTDSYISYKSSHHPATKIGTILWSFIKRRAESICMGEVHWRSYNTLRTHFWPTTTLGDSWEGNCTGREVRRWWRRNWRTRKNPLPSIHQGISENLQRICRQLSIMVIHKAPSHTALSPDKGENTNSRPDYQSHLSDTLWMRRHLRTYIGEVSHSTTSHGRMPRLYRKNHTS